MIFYLSFGDTLEPLWDGETALGGVGGREVIGGRLLEDRVEACSCLLEQLALGQQSGHQAAHIV